MEIPPQNRAENFASYVLRVCSTIETVRIPLTSEANSFRESTKDKDSRVEKVNGKNINCILRSAKRAVFLVGVLLEGVQIQYSLETENPQRQQGQISEQ